MIIDTASPEGEPWCPICETPVAREGEFCSPGCWEHLHIVVFEAGEPIISMNYLDITEQPWYSEFYNASDYER